MDDIILDDKIVDALIDGRLFIDENGCLITPDEHYFGYHSETDFSMDYLDYQDEF